MAQNKDAPELTLVKGGAEPVLEALAQRTAKQSGQTTKQHQDSTCPPVQGNTPYRPTYHDLREALGEAHAMLGLLGSGMRMISAGYGSAQEVRKLANSTVKAAACTEHYLGRLLEAVTVTDRRG